ncbi:MAG: AlkZ family DNA glycosylase [Chloroflexi bacterium]|nr:AlkZ family DNA glycosylase [Chloroflexota bacterium]
MTPQDIAQYRLYHQQIATTKFKKPSQVVSWLGAMQAQDYAGAKWSAGLRLPDATDADIEQAIADKTIIRTWPMRGTLHFVAAEDARWLLKLLTPRIIAQTAGRYRQLELDEATFARSKELFAQALQGGKQLTRNEMLQLLEKASISTAGQRGYHILGRSAQDGLICFGAPQGKQQTFTLLDEWAPATKSLERDEALAELGYTDRSAVLEAIHAPKIVPGNNGVFSPTIVTDGQVVGTWKRTFKKDTVVIETSPFTPLSEAQSRAVTVAAERYSRFVGMSTVVVS